MWCAATGPVARVSLGLGPAGLSPDGPDAVVAVRAPEPVRGGLGDQRVRTGDRTINIECGGYGVSRRPHVVADPRHAWGLVQVQPRMGHQRVGAGHRLLPTCPTSTHQHAVVWDGTTIRDLGTLGGLQVSGTAINDAGHVAGVSALTTDPNHRRAFYWDGTTMLDLETLGGRSLIRDRHQRCRTGGRLGLHSRVGLRPRCPRVPLAGRDDAGPGDLGWRVVLRLRAPSPSTLPDRLPATR